MCTVFPVGVACVERGVVVEAGKNYSGQSDGAAHRVRIAIEWPSIVQSDLRWVV